MRVITESHVLCHRSTLMRVELVQRDMASCTGYKINDGQRTSAETLHYHLVNHTNDYPPVRIVHIAILHL